MLLEEIYNHYGQNWVNVARELKIGATTLRNWKMRGSIPIRSQMILEKRTNGLFKAKFEDAKV